MLTRETDKTQDTNIEVLTRLAYSGDPQSQMWKSSESLSTHLDQRVQWKAWSSSVSHVSVYQEPEGSAVEG